MIGVVFHIKLFWVSTIRQWRQPYSIIKRRNIKEDLFIKETYAKAVQFSCCCRLDQSILLTALGIIHDKAMHAPKKWNSRSVTVATATPIDTIVNASTWDRQKWNGQVRVNKRQVKLQGYVKKRKWMKKLLSIHKSPDPDESIKGNQATFLHFFPSSLFPFPLLFFPKATIYGLKCIRFRGVPSDRKLSSERAGIQLGQLLEWQQS